jgi:hypothetical protein
MKRLLKIITKRGYKMSYPKGTCVSCGGETSTCYTPQCRTCYRLGRKPSIEDIERQKKIVSVYNKKYFLEHKKELREYRKRLYHKQPPETKRDKYLKRAYGLGYEEFESLYIVQRGLCGICGKFLVYGKDKMQLDHNHKTGHFRLILCPQCNSGLAFFKENIESLKSAIKYLGGSL